MEEIEEYKEMRPPMEQTITMCQQQIFTGKETLFGDSSPSPSFTRDKMRKNIGGKMKFSSVIVVEPMRLRIAPKLGRDNPMRSNKAIDRLLNTTRLKLNSKIKGIKLRTFQQALPVGIFRIDSKN